MTAAPADLGLLLRIDRYLDAAPRRGREVHEVHPFTIYFDPVSLVPFLSYARPSAPWRRPPPSLAGAITVVRSFFADRGRACRFEWLDELSPGLTEALRAADFPEPDVNPLMVVTRERLRVEAAPGVTVSRLDEHTPRDVIWAALAVAHQAFGGPPPTDAEVDRAIGQLESGRARMVAAFVEGKAVGYGMHVPLRGTSEIAGVATAGSARRRGVGASVSSALALDAFEAGCDLVFLTAADDTARSMYARLGFVPVGTGRGVMIGR